MINNDQRSRSGIEAGKMLIKDYSYFIITIFEIFLLSIFMSSCTFLHEIPHSMNAQKIRIIEDVPFFAQEDYQCGPSALAGVLNYWGVKVTPEEISKEIFSKTARGTLNIDMLLYAQKKGLNAVQYNGSLSDLKENIDSGFPVIVMVDLGISFFKANHFMAVTGYNEKGVIVNSGREKDKFLYEKDFLNAWVKTGYWTLLIKPNKSRTN